jgi:hypothetical protein
MGDANDNSDEVSYFWHLLTYVKNKLKALCKLDVYQENAVPNLTNYLLLDGRSTSARKREEFNTTRWLHLSVMSN